MGPKLAIRQTNRRNLPWLFALAISLWGTASFAVNNVHNNDTVTDYPTIQAAVDAALAGHTLVVSAGTYVEQVEITKDVTIIGDGIGSTIIQSPASLPLFFNTGANDNYPIVYIHDTASPVIQDLTIDGAGLGNANYRFLGIAFYNAGGTLLNAHVTNIIDTPFSGAQHGNAVYSYNPTGGAHSIEIGNVVMDDFQKNAMAMNGPDLTVDVHDCSITGAGSTGITAQNGVQISLGAGGTVTDCDVTGIDYTGATYTATGYLFYEATTVDCDNVTADQCQTSVYYIDAGGIFQNSTISNPIGDGFYAYSSGPSPRALPRTKTPLQPQVVDGDLDTQAQLRATIDVEVRACTATGTAVTDSWGVTAYGEGPITFNVENCFISNWDWGVVTYDFGGAVIDATVFENDLDGNMTYSVATNLTDVQDASANWHGATDAATVATVIDGNVDYSPWLNSGADQDGGTEGFQGDFSVLSVDDDSPTATPPGGIVEALGLVSGSTINVAAGTYSANLVLGSSINLLGAQTGVDARGRVAGAPNPLTESVLTAASGRIIQLTGGSAGTVIDGFAFSGAAKAIESTSGPIDDVQITNNYFTGHSDVALFMNDSGTDITVDQNEFDGATMGSTVAHFDQDNFDGLHFTNNNVLGGPGNGFFVDGNHNIGVSAMRAPSFSGNLFDGNAVGANLGRFAFEFGTISGNTFSNSGFDGLQGGIQNSTISGNTFDTNGRYGLALTGFGGSSDPTRGAQDNTISGNTFTGNVSAGLLYSSSQFPGTISTNPANNNDFTGNVVGASYSGTETIDVTCNWWGDIGGPDALGNPNPSGDDLDGSSFVYWNWLDGSITGTPSCTATGSDLVAADPTGLCISTATSCVIVPVNFTRVDTTPARGASVTFQLSPELELCGSITQGTWLSAYGTTYQIIDNGGGSYTVDQAILGLPCGITTGGQLFEIPVQKTAAVTTDAVGTITVTQVKVRDCSNVPLAGLPGAPAMIPINIEAPDAPTALASAQVKTGNDSDGTTEIDLSLTLPTAADFSYVDVYRKGFGDYPEYNDGTGALPAVPSSPSNAISNGWTLAITGATTTALTDDPGSRDYWYYVAFAYDECGNVSAVSNMTTGTLSYHLGDVTDGSINGNGDNFVLINDISHLGANYGLPLAFGDTVNYLDVGPTSDGSVDGLPQTDNVTDFEDLILFSINFGQVSLTSPVRQVTVLPPGTESPDLRLAVDPWNARPGTEVTARLYLEGNQISVKGSTARLSHQGLEVESVQAGSLIEGQPQVFFTSYENDGELVIDVVRLGQGTVIEGTGELAVITFRTESRRALPTLGGYDLRDLENHSLLRSLEESVETAEATDAIRGNEGSATRQLPTHVQLMGARPNPFGGSAEISFRLPEATRVDIRIYDIEGRLIRSLADREFSAGEHAVTWDGRSNNGIDSGIGVFFYRFDAGSYSETAKLYRYR